MPTSSRERSGEGLGAFLAHPAFQGLGAYLEVAGTGSGPNEDELRKLRELHARWTKPRARPTPPHEACDAGVSGGVEPM